jgi:hypothetical protein
MVEDRNSAVTFSVCFSYRILLKSVQRFRSWRTDMPPCKAFPFALQRTSRMYVYENAMLCQPSQFLNRWPVCQGFQYALGRTKAVLFTHSFLQTRELVKLVTLSRLGLGF